MPDKTKKRRVMRKIFMIRIETALDWSELQIRKWAVCMNLEEVETYVSHESE